MVSLSGSMLQMAQVDAANRFASQNRAGTSEIVLSDYRDMLRVINKLDREIWKDFSRNAREIARPARLGIKKSIERMGVVLRGSARYGYRYGMQPARIPGRLTYNTGTKSNQVLTNIPKTFGGARRFGEGEAIPIARLVMRSPATIIQDMAGRKGTYIDKRARTLPYPYTVNTKEGPREILRSHAINGQGRHMVEKLNKYRGASRAVYPAAEAHMDDVQDKMETLLMMTQARVQDALDRVANL